MDIELAERILKLVEDIDSFVEPSDRLPDAVTARLERDQDARIDRLDELCKRALRQMVIDEAREVVQAEAKRITIDPKLGW